MNVRLFLLLGTNLGDRAGNLRQAIAEIERNIGSVAGVSSVYRTAAWGKTDQPDFFNQAIAVSTELTAEDTLEYILAIELSMGRTRVVKWGERLIDIDIILFGDMVLQTERLTIPHPYMTQRRFVLEPLAEIAGGVIHPQHKKTIRELLAECPDKLTVTKVQLA